MLLLLATIAAVVLGVGEILVMAAAGTFKKELEWTDYVVMIVPLVVLESIVVSFVFLPLSVAIILAIVLVVALLWSVLALLKVPTKKRVR